MREGLQKDDGNGRETNAPLRTTTLILNKHFITDVLSIVEESKKTLFICAYAWRWYMNSPELGMQKFNIAVLRAKQRGVDVRCIVDNAITRSMLQSEGIPVKYINSNQIMHIKAICADTKTLVLGSHNLTKTATESSMEASVIIQEHEPVLQFEEYFRGMWSVLRED